MVHLNAFHMSWKGVMPHLNPSCLKDPVRTPQGCPPDAAVLAICDDEPKAKENEDAAATTFAEESARNRRIAIRFLSLNPFGYICMMRLLVEAFGRLQQHVFEINSEAWEMRQRCLLAKQLKEGAPRPTRKYHRACGTAS